MSVQRRMRLTHLGPVTAWNCQKCSLEVTTRKQSNATLLGRQSSEVRLLLHTDSFARAAVRTPADRVADGLKLDRNFYPYSSRGCSPHQGLGRLLSPRRLRKTPPCALRVPGGRWPPVGSPASQTPRSSLHAASFLLRVSPLLARTPVMLESGPIPSRYDLIVTTHFCKHRIFRGGHIRGSG